jgi:hypothetical protein
MEYRIIIWDGVMVHDIIALMEKQAIRKDGSFTKEFTNKLKQAFLDTKKGFRVQLTLV